TGVDSFVLNNLGWIDGHGLLDFASMRSWIVASIALALGGAVSAALIVFTSPDRDRVDVYAVAREVASGSELTHDSLRLQSVLMPEGLDTLFTRSDGSQLQGRHASHDLTAGQLLQRTDLLAPGGVADVRLVFLPIKDAPPAGPGSKLDLLLIAGTADHPAVVPFALGIEVRAVVTGSFVVAVPSRQASAFVYASKTSAGFTSWSVRRWRRSSCRTLPQSTTIGSSCGEPSSPPSPLWVPWPNTSRIPTSRRCGSTVPSRASSSVTGVASQCRR